MISNKSIGTIFEHELAQTLFHNGYWVHRFIQSQDGQPTDIIAVKNGKAYLIDCKVCENDVFKTSRIEENQRLSMLYWNECGNGHGWFALKMSKGVYMVNMYSFMNLNFTKSELRLKDLLMIGAVELMKWL